MKSLKKQQIPTKKKLYLVAIFLLPASFVLFQFIIQFSSGVIITDVMHSLSLNAIGASLLASSYYYIYVLMQTPAGVLVERFGPRLLLSLGAVICAAGGLCFMLASHLALAILGRVLMGAGMSCAFVSALFLYRNWFSTRIFAFLVSLLESLVLVFTVIGNITIAQLIHFAGWQQFVAYTVIIALGFAVLHFVVIRNTRERIGKLRPLTKKRPTTNFKHDVKTLFTNRRAIFNGLYCGIMMSPQTVFVALWGIPFLVHVHHYSIIRATVACSIVFFGVAVSGPIIGAIYTRINHHRWYFSGSAIATALLMSAAIFLPMNYFFLILTFFMIGFCSSTYLWNYVLIQRIVPNAAASTGIGFTNMLGMVVAPISQLLISLILSWLIAHPFPHGHANFPITTYQEALAVLPILYLIAAVLGLTLRRPAKAKVSITYPR